MKDCFTDTKNAYIYVKEVNGNCAFNLQPGQKFYLSDILPDGICFHAFHTFFPYYLTFENDGWFDWVRQGEGVCVHCPNYEGVIVKIYKSPKEGVVVRVVNNPKECHFSYVKDNEFKFSGFKFCPRALDVIYPYLLRCNNNPFLVSCPSNKNNVVFEVIKK